MYNETVVKGDKTAPRSKIHYFVGFHDTGYYTYEKATKKTYSSCNVKIDETIKYKDDYPQESSDTSFIVTCVE